MRKTKQYWLIKSEGDSYPIEQLKKEKKTAWSGVRNYVARNYMRDQMHVGDLCLFYHSSCNNTGVYGLARVASKPYPDPSQFDKKSHYYDPTSTRGKPRWMLVDISFVKQFVQPITTGTMKNDPALAGLVLWRVPRLSIQPVSEKDFQYITETLVGR